MGRQDRWGRAWDPEGGVVGAHGWTPHLLNSNHRITPRPHIQNEGPGPVSPWTRKAQVEVVDNERGNPDRGG